MPEALLEARGVSRAFGRRTVLEPVDLVVDAGERTALLGPNGAGKSTLLSLLAGALIPTAGDVRRAHGARVGWAPQRPGVYGKLTALENLELFAGLAGAAEPRADAARVVEELDVPNDRPASELSGGNRQRLNVGVALLGLPTVLLLDEPTSALDPRARRRLWDETLAAPGRETVVWATQSLDEAERADRVLVLVDGRLSFAGPPAELASSDAAEALG